VNAVGTETTTRRRGKPAAREEKHKEEKRVDSFAGCPDNKACTGQAKSNIEGEKGLMP